MRRSACMDQWMTIIESNSQQAWISACGIAIGTFLGTLLARRLAREHLAALARRTQTWIDDLLLLILQKFHPLIICGLAVSLASRALNLPDQLVRLIDSATVVAAFLQVALWGNVVINFSMDKSQADVSQSEGGDTRRRVFGFIARLVLWSLVLALILENLGVRLTPLLAGIGVGGIAIALAVQNILGDLFCYFAILLDKPFVVGDFLIIDQLMGTVERIGLKTTRIRALSGEQLIFSNQDLLGSRIRNYKSLAERRVVFRFGVTYETPPEKLRVIPNIVSDIVSPIELTRLDRVNLAELGAFSLQYEVVYFVLSDDYNRYMDIQEIINVRLIERLAELSISFAYPTQSLFLQKGAAHGS